ncbi:MAG: hypothetical protein MUC69_09565, partial [Gemmatimonadales bacterium]|nr:hypothetical protein [Gemmatimonadales bacterium]
LNIIGIDITGSGFYAKGMGAIFMGDAFLGTGEANQGVDSDGELQSSYGFIAQAMYTLPSKKLSFGGSYGGNYISDSNGYGQTALTFQGTYHWTKSLRAVAEYSLVTVGDDSFDADMNTFSAGLMLFY